MNPSAQAVLAMPPVSSITSLEDALITPHRAGEVDQARKIAKEILDRRAEPWMADPIVLEMPNGHRLEVAGNVASADSDLVGREYARVLEAELTARRGEFALKVFLVWAVPVLGLCAFGLLARWVYRGFRS